jgi:hypothetical protein
MKNWPQQRPAEAPSWRPATKNSDARQSAPANDKIDREGGAFQTATDAEVEFAARGENNLPATHGRNRMQKIPGAADGIELIHAAKCNMEEM